MSPLAPAFLLTALALALTAPYTSTQAAPLEEGVLATVNGNPITTIAVNNVADQITTSGETAAQENILNELINLEVLTQAAEKIDLDKVPAVAAAIQLQYTQTMANAYLARISSELSFSDAEVRAEYEAQTANVDRSEYQTSHILVGNQDTANDVIKDLSAGKEFEAMAKLYSTDPSGQSGGDLGWIQGSSLPPEFIEVVADLTVGDFSKTAVKTEYGFHIIKLNDKREASLPDLKSVEKGLMDLLVRKALAKHLEDLRAEAEIEQ
jgi:peptidyl-prolyl cis-trans isomerase C